MTDTTRLACKRGSPLMGNSIRFAVTFELHGAHHPRTRRTLCHRRGMPHPGGDREGSPRNAGKAQAFNLAHRGDARGRCPAKPLGRPLGGFGLSPSGPLANTPKKFAIFRVQQPGAAIADADRIGGHLWREMGPWGAGAHSRTAGGLRVGPSTRTPSASPRGRAA
jgi:hypothetical protein